MVCSRGNGAHEPHPLLHGLATGAPTGRTLDRDHRSFRYSRNAVERHWDPGAVEPALLSEVTDELLGLVQEPVTPDEDLPVEEMVLPEDELTSDAVENHTPRLEHLTDVDQAFPDGEELTRIEGYARPGQGCAPSRI